MPRLSVLLCTEGTYPFVGGGVSTWCDVLCHELEDVDFTLWTLTGGPEISRRYVLPHNVVQVVHMPLWGILEPAEFGLADASVAAVRARRARTPTAAIEDEFAPLLRAFLRGLEDDDVDLDEAGAVVHALWTWFRDHDWIRSWRSEAVWRVFLEEARRPYEGRPGDFLTAELPTVWDLTTALRWLAHFLVPLGAPVPRTDIVHSTIAAFAGLAGVIAKREYGTPFVVTDHGVWVRERYIAVSTGDFSLYGKRFLMRLSSYVSRVVYRYADLVLPVTGWNRRWEVPYGVEPGRIEVIANGVDPAVFVPRPKPPETVGIPVVVAAARIFPLKDIETMIRAAEVTRERVPRVQFIVYGALDADPPYAARCQELVAELGLERTFELRGHHANPAALYAEGDISALSSISEAFPYTVLESLACARPVVGTDVGGVSEALEGLGIIVPPRDPQAFGDAVVTLLEDDDLRLELGRRGREGVLARFRLSRAIDSYRDVYARLTAVA